MAQANKILIVEDSRVLATNLAKRIQREVGVEVLMAASLKQAKSKLEQHGEEIFLMLLDLRLPDAGHRETIESLKPYDIPMVVFTATHDSQFRDWVLEAGVVDYIVKRSLGSVDAVVSLVRRLSLNRSIEVLVVDDSPAHRRLVRQHVEQLMLRVHEAEHGLEALGVLKDHPAIRLIVTDYVMPHMDGCQLIQAVRERFVDRDIRIVGLSAEGSASALLLKTGADDFLHTPFSTEEFQCRVGKILEHQEYVARLHEAATQDYLTKLANRRHFFSLARPLFASAGRSQISLAVGIMDLDRFKAVNDTHGHDAGDEVLRVAADILRENQRDTDVVGRLGGEEFGFVLVGSADSDWFACFERVRKAIAAHEFVVEHTPFSVTASFGVCTSLLESLDEMINRADRCLYEAKTRGRNQIVMDHH